METATSVPKPTGGFCFVTVAHWGRLWRALQAKQLRLLDVCVWCAAHEAMARRCRLPSGQPRHITEAELASLVGAPHVIRAALRRLTAAGLLTWQDAQLTLPSDRAADGPCEERSTMLSAFPNPRRRIPVPRRVLRFLARCRRRSLIATTIGHLIRCLYYRHGQCQPVGLCKASWIAAMFGLSLRSVKGARQALERLGLVQRIETPHWVRNRYGPKMRINLHWAGEQSSAPPPTADRIAAPESAGSACGKEANRSPAPVLAASHAAPQLATPAEIAPPIAVVAPEIAPPDSYKELSLREEDIREPAARRATGFFITMVREAREHTRSGAAPRDEEARVPPRMALASRVVPAPHTAQSPPHPASPLPRPPATQTAPRAAGRVAPPPRPTPAKPPRALPPTLRHITLGDLRDTTRVLVLYEQAVAAQRIGRTEAERLTFVALAQHVLARRPRSPGGLFMYLLTKRLFHVITQAEEDAAQQRLKRVLCGDPPAWGEPSSAPVAHQIKRKGTWAALYRGVDTEG